MPKKIRFEEPVSKVPLLVTFTSYTFNGAMAAQLLVDPDMRGRQVHADDPRSRSFPGDPFDDLSMNLPGNSPPWGSIYVPHCRHRIAETLVEKGFAQVTGYKAYGRSGRTASVLTFDSAYVPPADLAEWRPLTQAETTFLAAVAEGGRTLLPQLTRIEPIALEGHADPVRVATRMAREYLEAGMIRCRPGVQASELVIDSYVNLCADIEYVYDKDYRFRR